MQIFSSKQESQNFKECCYWLFSFDRKARIARAQNAIPYSIFDKLSNQEKEKIKTTIYHKMKSDKMSEIYIRLLIYSNDKNSIPSIRKQLMSFEMQNKVDTYNFNYEISFCKKAIATLQRI